MVRRLAVHLCTFACCLSFSSALFAAQLTGTVTNATTGKPAAGDDVTLLSLTGGMQETSSARTDAQGKFTLDEPDEAVEHLIRVNHDGAFYFKSAPVGTRTSDVNVYDVAAKVDNILQQGHVFQMQTGNGQLEVSEKYILRNESAPPRVMIAAVIPVITVSAREQSSSVHSGSAVRFAGPIWPAAVPSCRAGRPLSPGDSRGPWPAVPDGFSGLRATNRT
jgi:5-hydroxyisourate hydrolase-like protein (transthyretin family)